MSGLFALYCLAMGCIAFRLRFLAICLILSAIALSAAMFAYHLSLLEPVKIVL